MNDNHPLSDVLVLDLGQIYNGPYATFLMAMAGARVIKVESLVGEALRGRGENSSAAWPFTMLNQNKESITLNLKSDKGKEMFRELVKKADVVLENFSPDTMENLGLGPDALREVNPRLINAAGSGYGRSGEHRDFLAMDITVQAMSGIMSCTGVDEMPPMKSGAALCDFFGGVHLYGAVVTALFDREKTGKGAFIDIAMEDTVLPTLATVVGAYYFHDREIPKRTGNRHPALTLAPYNVYPAKDGHVAIICIREGHWRALAGAMERPELIEDEKFGSMAARAAAMDEVDELVSAWTSQRTKQEALTILQEAGVPSSMVRNVEEVLNDSHLHAKGMLRRVQHPAMGDIVLSNSPINVARDNPITPQLPPALGEQNAAVYKELLGLSDETLRQLSEQDVI
ncbi:MAG: CoA transferase [Pseudomonadales bacterium]|nr:CoA transferase [Pseudomonadales bacterium]